MSIDYIEPVPVLSSCQRMLVVDVRTATRLFIHWFRPNFSDLVYNGHQGPDTFTPDRHLQLLWFQVGIHPLNIPEKGEKGGDVDNVESLKIIPLLLISEL